MRSVHVLLSLVLPLTMVAQLQSTTRLELTGTIPESRQVRGLADPLTNDAAVTVDAARAGSMSFATVSGTAQITGDLQPAPTGYAVGMIVTVVPDMTNAAGPTLELNGLGQRPIVKWGQVPLDSADLIAGAPARMIYDGDRFLLLNEVSRPCPTGFQVMSPTTCIGQQPEATVANFYDAVTACHSMGARLCNMGEWTYACQNTPGILASVLSGEWVDDGANSGSDGKVLGTGYYGSTAVTGVACTYANTLAVNFAVRYRCCYSR